MRIKLQDKMFEISYLFELFISLIVGIAILVFGVRLVFDVIAASLNFESAEALVKVFDDAIILAIGAELIKMLCKHTPETVIEVLAFALARQLIVGHAAPLQNLITVVAIAALFATRRFLLKRHDMIETPEGLVDMSADEEMEKGTNS